MKRRLSEIEIEVRNFINLQSILEKGTAGTRRLRCQIRLASTTVDGGDSPICIRFVAHFLIVSDIPHSLIFNFPILSHFTNKKNVDYNYVTQTYCFRTTIVKHMLQARSQRSRSCEAVSSSSPRFPAASAARFSDDTSGSSGTGKGRIRRS